MNVIRSQAKTLMWLVTVPLAALMLLAVLLVGTVVWQGGRYADVVVIYYLPMALYIWAIWMVRRALASIADGEPFADIVPALLTRVGLAMFAGAVFTVIGVPLLSKLAFGELVSRPFEASAVALGVIGLTLALLARLLDRAGAMRRELGEFF